MNKREEPLLSVLIPVYNVGRYLSECIDSILTQTYDKLEIILVNDGSTDDSGEVCDAYAKRDSRIRVVHKENSGISDTRRLAASLASGAYCACIDSDDWIASDYFEKMAAVICEYEPDMVCCGFIKAKGSEREEHPLAFRSGYYDKQALADEISPCLLARADGCVFPVNMWAKAYKTSLYRRIQALVDASCGSAEDLGCTAPLLYCCESLYLLKESLYFYRFNPDSVCNVRRAKSWEEPRAIERTLKKTIPMDERDYTKQLKRLLFMDIYNVVATQMKCKKSYQCIARDIREHLTDPYIRDIVQTCDFSDSKSYTLKKWMLKHKLVLPIYIWFRKRFGLPLIER